MFNIEKKDWEKTTIEEIATIKGGKRMPKGRILLETETPHPYIKVKNMHGSKIINLDKDFEFVSENDFEKISNYTVKSGDIIISIVGTIGLVSLVGETLNNANLTENCVKLINIDNFSTEYLYYYLTSEIGQYEIAKGIVGSTQPKLPIYNIKKISIPRPPLKDQKLIANILSSFDDKIENNNAIIANLEEQAQTIFKSWFVDFEPFQDGEFVESDLGDIPKGWSIESLGDIVNIYDSERKPLSQMVRQGMERNYPYYGANGVIDYVEDYLFDGKYLLLGEDGTVQTNEGYPILNYIEEKCWVSNHAHIMTGDKISTEFLYVSIKRRNIRDIITGAVQQKINQRNLKSIKLVIPESNILINFQNIIEPIFEKVLVLKKSNKKLEETRDILLPKLMSGEIRVEEAIEVEEM